MRSAKFWLLAALLTLPAFGLMLRPGTYTIHDPHLFRIQQFDRCFTAGIFPCRWSPDSSKGYGSPLFNFYAQFPYWLTQAFRVTGLSLIDSAKAGFIFSLVASAVAMYFLAGRFFGRFGGLVAAAVYVFAPYRAVDVWVRGALPEALAFVWYPLILLFLDHYLATKKTVFLVLFSGFIALLITTHNLSFLMFAPFLLAFCLYRCIAAKSCSGLIGLIPAGLLSLALSAYYWLPVLAESRLVTLDQTVSGYYDFHIHFTTLKELFITRFWGYGASLWAEKFLSVSVGQVQWLLPLVLFLAGMFHPEQRTKPAFRLFSFLAGCGLAALFLTHGKSSVIWNFLPVMKYIQFPWRFLTVAVFFLALAAGYTACLVRSKLLLSLVITLALLTSGLFFRPDIWRDITDAEITAGPLWDEGRSSSLTDFWPRTAVQAPDDFAPRDPQFPAGEGLVVSARKFPASAEYNLYILASDTEVAFPIVYFPGWTAFDHDQPLAITPGGKLGLITARLTPGRHRITLYFCDTAARTAGNIISLAALISLPLCFLKKRIG